MVFRDGLTTALAASGDLFPAPVPKALLFSGCCVAQLVKLGLGDLCAKESMRTLAMGTYGVRNAD